MTNFWFRSGVRRRELFRIATAAALTTWVEPFAFGASDFWNKKKPDEWTEQEKDELRTKSPWAKKVDGAISAAGGRGGQGGDTGGRGSGRAGTTGGGDDTGFGVASTSDIGGASGEGGGGGGGGRGGRGGGGGGGADSVAPAAPAVQTVPLVVVWQSAKPVQDARPIALGDKLDNHYVVAVTGIPARVLTAAVGRGGRGRGEGDSPEPPSDPNAPLKRGVTITVKGKAPQASDVVMSTNNNVTLFFGFSKAGLSLSPADKEVEFDLKFGGLTAKAKFTLKEMMYLEQLAL